MTRGQPFPGRGVLLFVRHGETDWNRERRIMGRLPVDLNDVGRRQVERLASLIEDLHVGEVVTSPMVRTRSTAAILATALGAPPVVEDEGLAEVRFGAWEGRSYAELAATPDFREFLRSPIELPLPGGGESLAEVRERVYAAAARACERRDGGVVLLVSHGDPIRLLLAGCLGLAAEDFRCLRVDHAALSAVELSGDRVEVKFVNAHPELPGLARR